MKTLWQGFLALLRMLFFTSLLVGGSVLILIWVEAYWELWQRGLYTVVWTVMVSFVLGKLGY